MTTKYPDRANMWCSRGAVEKVQFVCKHMEETTYKSTGIRVKIPQGVAIEALIDQYLKSIKEKK